MTFPALYAIVLGLMIIGQWAFFYRTGRIPELKTAPLAITFHIGAELLMALVLIAAGIGLLQGVSWGVKAFMVAAGMVIYSVINSPGYFAQRREWLPVGMFAVVLALTVTGLVLVW